METWHDGAVYNRRFEFRYGDCDDKEEASLFAVMKLLSEIAGEDYAARGISRAVLMERKQVFLLSRMAFRFHRKPRFGEKTIASAWAQGIKGPMFCRDYEIKSEDGQPLISGSSAWLLANPVTREVLRPAAFGELPEMNPRRADCPDTKKLRKNPELGFLGGRPVYYSDLDSNGHINNAIYGRIAVDYLPQRYREANIKDIFITFNLETKPNETLEMRGGETDGGYAIQGCVNGELHFAVEFLLD